MSIETILIIIFLFLSSAVADSTGRGEAVRFLYIEGGGNGTGII